MNYSCMFDDLKASTGSRLYENVSSEKTVWGDLWNELLRTTAIQGLLFSSTTITKSITAEAMPILNVEIGRSTADMLKELRMFFGINVKDTADILKVSRPMIYHYQKGMEPEPENRRRLTLLTSFVDEWKMSDQTLIQGYLKIEQPEGKSLFDYLNEKEVDVTAVREILRRATTSDRRVRESFARNIIVGETLDQRRDIAQERHASGKAVYVADQAFPNKIVQVLSDGTRTVGSMVDRKFVPDGE